MDLAKVLGVTESGPGFALGTRADEADAGDGGEGEGDVVGGVLAGH